MYTRDWKLLFLPFSVTELNISYILISSQNHLKDLKETPQIPAKNRGFKKTRYLAHKTQKMATAALEQAVNMLTFDGDFQMIQPLWEVVANFAVDFSVVLSFTAVAQNVFGGNFKNTIFEKSIPTPRPFIDWITKY